MFQFHVINRTAVLMTASVLTLFAADPDAQAKGKSNETILYNFQGGSDGAGPQSGLIRDKQGNFYGTTQYGGGNTSNGCSSGGCGTVFKLAPDGTETVLHAFNGTDGDGPVEAPLVMDKAGNLYGTTTYGGSQNAGVVFKLAPDGTETVLHSFANGSVGPDGSYPQGGLLMDRKGNLYGTTTVGGGGNCGYYSNCGTVFKLTPDGQETVLFAFDNTCCSGGTGSFPSGDLAMDKLGNLYGTVQGYTPGAGGGVYRLSPTGAYTILYAFAGRPNDGASPVSGVIMDKAGNLYGTTEGGGTQDCDCGVVYKLAPDGTETVLHFFTGSPDGAGSDNIAMDDAGNLFGTTFHGGSTNCTDGGCGIVWEVTPAGQENILYTFLNTPDSCYARFGRPLVVGKGQLYGVAGGCGANGAGTIFRVKYKAAK